MRQANQQKVTPLVRHWFSVISVGCREMRIEMLVLLSASVSSHALRNPSRKSLQLLCLQGGERNLQVLKSAKTAKAKRDHLFLSLDMQIATSMAPPQDGVLRMDEHPSDI